MKNFFHLLKRELADRRYFFAAALAIGFSPYLLAPVAVASADELDEVRIAIARVVLAGFLIGVPLVLGARWLVADFANGRRGFELARPVSAWDLCSSKLAAAAVTISIGAFLAGLPTMIATDPRIFELSVLGTIDQPGLWLALLPVLAVLGAWVFFNVAQSLSFLLVDRGWLAAADFGALLLFAGLLGYVYQRCQFFGALGIAAAWLPRLVFAVGVLAIFGAWRSFRAGSLLDRAHRGHSLAMNLGLPALGLATALAATWVIRPDPGQLVHFTLALPNADATRWLVAGPQGPNGFEPLFAVDPAKKEATYLAPRGKIESSPWLSADGRRIGFLRANGSALRIYEFEGGGTRGILDAQGWEKNILLMGVDDRLETMASLDFSGNISSFSLEYPSRQLSNVQSQDLRGHRVSIVHRAGSIFAVLVGRHDGNPRDANKIWTINHFTFDAKSGDLQRGEPWVYPAGYEPPTDPVWWREALPLLEAGMSLSQLAPHPHIVALEGGRGLVPAWRGPPSEKLDAGLRQREWIFFDAKTPRGFFRIRPELLPVGEIRPGLLLVGYPEILESFPRIRQPGLWQTLVVEVPSGRILRVLQGYAPMKHPQGGRKVWLVDRSGAPYDLESAEADPKPILPWRPLSAFP